MSLLIRVSRNCPWNRCAFCPVYKGERFSRRAAGDVIADIDLMKEAAGRVRERVPDGGDLRGLSSGSCLELLRDPATTETEKRLALWLLRGGRHVFLQDADSLAGKSDRIVAILKHLYEAFPSVDRVTTYARSKTLAKRSAAELAALREAGLTRIHVGLESGAREVLDLIDKGVTPDQQVDGCRKAIEAGFELCCYVMPGLGGSGLTDEHARETARILKAINPTHVRLRTLWIVPGTPLDDLYQQGDFEPLEEDALVAEIQAMLAGMVGIDGRVVSDHDLNLLGDVEGHITSDAERLQAICQRFLDLDPETRDAFVAGRRSGYFGSLDPFLGDPHAKETFAKMAVELRQAGGGSLIRGIMRRLGRRSL